MALAVIVFAAALVLAVAIAVDRLSGRTLGWLVLFAPAVWIGWPGPHREQNVYALGIAATVLVGLTLLYILTRIVLNRRRAPGEAS